LKTPRDIPWQELVRGLSKFGYVVVRQTGSHIRLTTRQNGEHHLTAPVHEPIRTGIVNGIMNECAAHLGRTKAELLTEMFR
jgi:predicted RNA binding protein YcfA (HicA-like mRNA interferase family)